MRKRIFASFLALVMAVSLLPMSVLAASGDTPNQNYQAQTFSFLTKDGNPVKSTNGHTVAYAIWKDVNGIYYIAVAAQVGVNASTKDEYSVNRITNAQATPYMPLTVTNANDSQVVHINAIAPNATEVGGHNNNTKYWNLLQFTKTQFENYITTDGKLNIDAILGGGHDLGSFDIPSNIAEDFLPKIEVTKTLTSVMRNNEPYDGIPELLKVGDVLTWTITVKNTGTGTANDLVLTDVLKSGDITVAPETVTITAQNPSDIDKNRFALSAGNEATFTAEYIVKNTDAGKFLLNTAYVNGEPGTDNERRVEAGTLVVTKTVSGLDNGAVLPENFTIQITDSNNRLYKSLTPTESTDENVTYGAPTSVNGVYTWTISDVPLDTYTVTEMNVDVDGYYLDDTSKRTDSKTLEPDHLNIAAELNNVYVKNTTGLDINKVISKIGNTDIPADKQAGNRVNVGDTITWTITVTNTGTTILTDIPVQDFMTVGGNTYTLYLSASPVTVITLNPGETKTLQAFDKVEAGEEGKVIANRVIATVDGKKIPDTSEDITVNDPKLSVTKDVLNIKDADSAERSGKGTAYPGDTITWNITVTNTGNVELAGINLNDQMYNGDVNDSNNLGQAQITEENATNFTLAVGASETFTATYTVTQNDINKTIVNVATAENDKANGTDDAPGVKVEDPIIPVSEYQINIEKIVKQGGNVTPPSETFTFELFGLKGNEKTKIKSLNIETSTTGTSTTGVIYINTNDFDGYDALIIREASGTLDNWTYSELTYLVESPATPVTAEMETQPVQLNISPVILTNGEYEFAKVENGVAVALGEKEDPVTLDTASFTNTYTKTVNNGGSGSTKPPVLNKDDHFGYIIGYPVDYYTGEPTDDQTKKPVKPEGSITRAEVATIFFRMLTDESRTQYWTSTNSYTDVPMDAWYNNAVSTLSKAGIINGYEDGSFKPNGKITRAEFATIAVRFFDVKYDGKDLFPDIDGHWAKDYINQAGDAGIVNGYPDGTFGPQKLITRAEAVTMVNRTLDRRPDAEHFLKDMLVWPDNMDTTKWYYADMQEATNSHEYQMKGAGSDKYEVWTKMLPIRDWEAFEKEWSDAGSASNPGDVVR